LKTKVIETQFCILFLIVVSLNVSDV